MPLEPHSLLVAIAFAAACLTVVLFAVWLSARSSGFLLAWSVGALLVMANAALYGDYLAGGGRRALAAAAAVLMIALATLHGAAIQFRSGRFPFGLAAGLAVGSALLAVTPVLAGADGLGLLAVNSLATAFLLAIAGTYWGMRAESRRLLTAVAGLYGLTAVSFVLCGILIVLDGQFVLDRPPDNWAETLNSVVSIVAVIGIGALSLALSQQQSTSLQDRGYARDPLTGLLSRRGLFEFVARHPLPAGTVMIVFDIADLGRVNAAHGYEAGDAVLRGFAAALAARKRSRDLAARIGGDEFALLLPDLPGEAATVVDRIREAFAAEQIPVPGIPGVTVDAGSAHVADGQHLGVVIATAERDMQANRSRSPEDIPLALRLAG